MGNIKGVVLAGGLGTRMGLFTRRLGNKHVIPCYNRPMIEFPLSNLSQAGIKDVAIISSNVHCGDIIKLIGDGKEYGFENVSYKIQVGEGGIAHALQLAEEFVGDDNCLVMLGDNFYEMDFRDYVENFEKGARVILKDVEDATAFGVAELDGEMIVGIEEKPKAPKSNWAVTGSYLMDNRCFQFAKTLKPSGRGELEITDLLEHYMNLGELSHHKTTQFWSDMGQTDSLVRCSKWLMENEKSLKDRGRFSKYKFDLGSGLFGDYWDA